MPMAAPAGHPRGNGERRRIARFGAAGRGAQLLRRARCEHPSLVIAGVAAGPTEGPPLFDDHPPAPHRGREQQHHPLDDDVGVQKQADDRKRGSVSTHRCAPDCLTGGVSRQRGVPLEVEERCGFERGFATKLFRLVGH
jgi:hypothetical protein